jgi:hypothetical protein
MKLRRWFGVVLMAWTVLVPLLANLLATTPAQAADPYNVTGTKQIQSVGGKCAGGNPSTLTFTDGPSSVNPLAQQYPAPTPPTLPLRVTSYMLAGLPLLSLLAATSKAQFKLTTKITSSWPTPTATSNLARPPTTLLLNRPSATRATLPPGWFAALSSIRWPILSTGFFKTSSSRS